MRILSFLKTASGTALAAAIFWPAASMAQNAAEVTFHKDIEPILQMVAEVLRGRKVAKGTRLLVAPSSKRTMAEAAADGTLATIVEAGATLLPTGCGACAALGAGILAEEEVCISSTNRNFQGRSGPGRLYLASPLTVAASAVEGRIVSYEPGMFRQPVNAG